MRQYDKQESHIIANYYIHIWYESRGDSWVRIKERVRTDRYIKSIIDFKINNSGLKRKTRRELFESYYVMLKRQKE
jgi:hypothetical protein